MAKSMLVIGLVSGIFLLNPQWAARQIDQAFVAMGWKSATGATGVTINFAPTTPPRR
jgi:hypothetical protein